MTTGAPISDNDSDFMFSHNLFDYDFEFNYHNMVEQRTLRGLAAHDSLFVVFPSLCDFDDTYNCDVYTDTHLCSVYTEIEVVLQVDISTEKVIVADVNVVLVVKILSSIKQPST